MDQQTEETIEDNWYYIIIQDPGTPTEQFVGFSQGAEKFLPAFSSKDQAKACFALMPKDLFNGNYDTQAVIEEDLLRVAQENGHNVYLLDGKGNILGQLRKEGQ